MASVVEILEKNRGRTIISFEVVPPLKSGNINELFLTLEKLKKFSPAFINVTTHSSRYVEVKQRFFKKKIKKVKKRPGTVSISTAIKNRYNITTIPHVLCRGFSKISTENTLIELNYLGITDLLLLRGDQTNKSDYEKKNKYLANDGVLDLIQQVNDINQGKLLDTSSSGVDANFVYGVGGYPEKHPDAKSLDEDIDFLKKKIELGAKYIITQFFFDNAYFFNFYEKCRQAGITVPIIPGLKVLGYKKQLQLLPKIFHITMPDEFKEKVEAATDAAAVKKVGVDWCVDQCRSLLKFGVPVLHFYTMSKAYGSLEVLKRLDLNNQFK